MRVKALKAAFPYTIPVMTGYLFLGVAFGVLLAGKGYGVLWALLMSGLIFAGAMQFAAIGILTGPFALFSVIALTLSINARHLFYGLSMIGKYRDMGGKKPYMIFSLTDETYCLICGVSPPGGVDKNWFYFFIALLNQIYWVTGSVLGAALGSLISFNTKGIDFAMTALFVVIFVEQWESAGSHLPALSGLVLTLFALLIFGAESFIIVSMLAILALLTALRRRIGGERDDGDRGVN